MLVQRETAQSLFGIPGQGEVLVAEDGEGGRVDVHGEEMKIGLLGCPIDACLDYLALTAATGRIPHLDCTAVELELPFAPHAIGDAAMQHAARITQ